MLAKAIPAPGHWFGSPRERFVVKREVNKRPSQRFSSCSTPPVAQIVSHPVIPSKRPACVYDCLLVHEEVLGMMGVAGCENTCQNGEALHPDQDISYPSQFTSRGWWQHLVESSSDCCQASGTSSATWTNSRLVILAEGEVSPADVRLMIEGITGKVVVAAEVGWKL